MNNEIPHHWRELIPNHWSDEFVQWVALKLNTAQLMELILTEQMWYGQLVGNHDLKKYQIVARMEETMQRELADRLHITNADAPTFYWKRRQSAAPGATSLAFSVPFQCVDLQGGLATVSPHAKILPLDQIVRRPIAKSNPSTPSSQEPKMNTSANGTNMQLPNHWTSAFCEFVWNGLASDEAVELIRFEQQYRESVPDADFANIDQQLLDKATTLVTSGEFISMPEHAIDAEAEYEKLDLDNLEELATEADLPENLTPAQRFAVYLSTPLVRHLKRMYGDEALDRAISFVSEIHADLGGKEFARIAANEPERIEYHVIARMAKEGEREQRTGQARLTGQVKTLEELASAPAAPSDAAITGENIHTQADLERELDDTDGHRSQRPYNPREDAARTARASVFERRERDHIPFHPRGELEERVAYLEQTVQDMQYHLQAGGVDLRNHPDWTGLHAAAASAYGRRAGGASPSFGSRQPYGASYGRPDFGAPQAGQIPAWTTGRLNAEQMTLWNRLNATMKSLEPVRNALKNGQMFVITADVIELQFSQLLEMAFACQKLGIVRAHPYYGPIQDLLAEANRILLAVAMNTPGR